MTYDPVDANDDGIVESDVDNESVNTDGLTTDKIGGKSGRPYLEDDVEVDGNSLRDDDRILSIYEKSIADGSKEQFDPGKAAAQGLYMVHLGGTGGIGVILLGGGIETVAISHDLASDFSTTEGNSGTLNVYYDPTDGRYEVENQTGSTRSLDVFRFARAF